VAVLIGPHAAVPPSPGGHETSPPLGVSFFFRLDTGRVATLQVTGPALSRAYALRPGLAPAGFWSGWRLRTLGSGVLAIPRDEIRR
jgi:hypothetical protein